MISPEARKEQLHLWYTKNRDKVLAKSRARHKEKHKEIRHKAMERYRNDPIGVMLGRSRQRAKTKGIPFSITRQDIDIPDFCPVLRIPLQRALGNGSPLPNSPSLDRFDSSLGYVPGNVRIISYKANCMKSNATWSELEQFALWIFENAPNQGLFNYVVEKKLFGRFG